MKTPPVRENEASRRWDADAFALDRLALSDGMPHDFLFGYLLAGQFRHDPAAAHYQAGRRCRQVPGHPMIWREHPRLCRQARE